MLQDSAISIPPQSKSDQVSDIEKTKSMRGGQRKEGKRPVKQKGKDKQEIEESAESSTDSSSSEEPILADDSGDSDDPDDLDWRFLDPPQEDNRIADDYAGIKTMFANQDSTEYPGSSKITVEDLDRSAVNTVTNSSKELLDQLLIKSEMNLQAFVEQALGRLQVHSRPTSPHKESIVRTPSTGQDKKRTRSESPQQILESPKKKARELDEDSTSSGKDKHRDTHHNPSLSATKSTISATKSNISATKSNISATKSNISATMSHTSATLSKDVMKLTPSATRVSTKPKPGEKKEEEVNILMKKDRMSKRITTDNTRMTTRAQTKSQQRTTRSKV